MTIKPDIISDEQYLLAKTADDLSTNKFSIRLDALGDIQIQSHMSSFLVGGIDEDKTGNLGSFTNDG